MNQPYPYPQQPGGYGPQGPHGSQQQQQQRPGAVELKVSYVVPIVLLLVIGAILLAIAMVQLIDTQTAPPPTPPVAIACTDELSGLHPTCTDARGRKLAWTAQLPGNYRFQVDAPAPHALSIEKGTTKVKAIAGKAGTNTLFVDLDKGDYSIRVDDPPVAAANKGYTLKVDWMAKKGQPPGELATGRTLKPEFWASLIAALVCFAVAPLVLLLKRSVPLRLDPNGVTMRDGRTYPWNELLGIRFVSVRMRGEVRESSAELTFRSGRAVILYGRVKNLYQVKPILEAFAQGRNPWA